MKKKTFALVALISAIVVSLALALAGCVGTETDNKLLIIAPDGAPAFAMAQLFHELPQIDGVEVEYRVANADEAKNLMSSGEADIAILPTNTGAILYNSGEDVRLVGATTLGVMYLVSRDPAVKTLNDLAGKTLVSIGQGNVPEFVLRYLLKHNGVENVTIEFNKDGSEVVSGLVADTIQIGSLGEPAATGAIGKLKKEAGVTANVIDLQAEWEKVTGNKGYPQSGLFTRTEIYRKYPEFFKSIAAKIANASNWIKENFDQANAAVRAAGGLTKLPAAGVADKIRVGFKTAADVKTELNEYFGIMGGLEPRFIGYAFPKDDFYLA